MISYVLWYHNTKHDIIVKSMISHNVSDIITPIMISDFDVMVWCHIWYHVIWYHMCHHRTSYVTSCMISCMISYIWYHMPGASVLMYRTYDILIWYHNIWYHRCASFFWIYFWISMHKKRQNAPCWCKDSNPDLHTERQPI